MAFSIVGPGIRDEIKLANLFEKKEIARVDATVRIRRIDKDLEIDTSNQYGRERIRQAYSDGGQAGSYKELIAEQLMSSPVSTLPIDTSIEDAWHFFRQHRFRHVPIVDEENNLQGIISDRDLLAVVEYRNNQQQVESHINNVNGIMKTKVLTATSDTIVSQIAAVFFQQRVGAMPILSEDKLVGIITRSDILGAVVYSQPMDSWA